MMPLEQIREGDPELDLEDRVNGLRHFLDTIPGHRIWNWDYGELLPRKSITPADMLLDQRSFLVAQQGDTVIVRDPDYSKAHLRQLNQMGFGTSSDHVHALGYRGMSINEMIASSPVTARRLEDETDERARGEEKIYLSYDWTRSGAEVADLLGATYLGDGGGRADHFKNKAVFRELARELGISVPEGRVVDVSGGDNLVQALEEAVNKWGTAFVRGVKGACGNSAYRCDPEDPELAPRALAQILLEEDSNDVFLVDREYELNNNVSVLYRLLDGGVQRLSPVSGQIMEGPSNRGNFYHSGMESWKEVYVRQASRELAVALSALGMRGDIGFDWFETEDEEIFPAEVNPRITGQTPLAYLNSEMHRRTGEALYMALFKLSHEPMEFEELEKRMRDGENSLFYDGNSNHGVIPAYVPNMSREGTSKYAVVAPERRTFEDLTTEVIHRISPGEADYVLESIQWLNAA